MTDFEIEKGMSYVFNRVIKYAESVEMAFDNGLAVDPVLADDGAYFSLSVVTVKRCNPAA